MGGSWAGEEGKLLRSSSGACRGGSRPRRNRRRCGNNGIAVRVIPCETPDTGHERWGRVYYIISGRQVVERQTSAKKGNSIKASASVTNPLLPLRT